MKRKTMIPIASTPISIQELLPLRSKPNYLGMLTDSGRSALKIALDQIPKKTKRIAVPAYTCPVIYDIIMACDFFPVVIDVELDTYEMKHSDLEEKIREGLDAIIVVHLFGNLTSIEDIRTISDGIPIIEDCAQYMVPDQLPKGDMAIFSFGLGKVITCGGGGALVVNNNNFAPKLPEQTAGSIVSLVKIWGMKFGTIPFLYRKKMSLHTTDYVWRLQPKKMNPALFANLNKQMKMLPKIISQRRRNARILSELLHQDFDSLPQKQIYTRFLIKWKNPIGLRNRLFQAGIESEVPYPRLNQIIPKRNFRNAAFLMATSLSLPVNHRIHEKQLRKIAEIIETQRKEQMVNLIA